MKKRLCGILCLAVALAWIAAHASAEGTCQHSEAYVLDAANVKGEKLVASDAVSHTVVAESADVRYYCPFCGKYLSEDYQPAKDVEITSAHTFDGAECEFCKKYHVNSIANYRSFSYAGQGTCSYCGETVDHEAVKLTMVSDKELAAGEDLMLVESRRMARCRMCLIL